MGFGSMIHRSCTGDVRKQDIINVKDFLMGGTQIIMNEDGSCDIKGEFNIDNLGIKSFNQLVPRIKKSLRFLFLFR